MEHPSETSIFEMSIEELQERVALACEMITSTHQAFQEEMERHLNDGADADADGYAVETTGTKEKEPPLFKDTIATLQETFERVLTLLPGMVSLSPERRLYLQATTPSFEDLSEMLQELESVEARNRLPDTTPDVFARHLERARILFIQCELLGSVQTATLAVLADISRYRKLLLKRVAQRLDGVSSAELN